MTVDNKRGAQQSTSSGAVDADKQAQMNAVWQRIEKKSGGATKKPKNLAFKIILPIFILENIGLAVLAVLLLIGTIGFSTKAPEAKTVSVYNVCGRDMVDEYNQIYSGYDIGSEDYNTKLSDLASRAAAQKHSSDDATCQYIILEDALNKQNVGDARSAVDRMSLLAEDGVYPSNEIVGMWTLDNLEQYVKSIEDISSGNYQENTENPGLEEGQG